jgi:hypothetical protein
MAPGVEQYATRYRESPLNAAEIAGFRNGRFAMFMGGEILYQDIFGVSRFTRYTMVRRGPIDLTEDERMTFWREGNDAN